MSDLAVKTLFAQRRPSVTWTSKLPTAPAAAEPAVIEDQVTLGDQDGGLHSYDSHGTHNWSTPLGDEVKFPPVPGPDDTLAVVTKTGLHLVDSDSGQVLWSKDLKDTPTGPPVILEDRVYVATEWHRKILGFDLEGEEKFNTSIRKPPVAFFIVPDGRGKLLAVSRAGDATPIDPNAWVFKKGRRRRVAGMPHEAPKVGPDGKAYFAAMEVGSRYRILKVDNGEVEVVRKFPDFMPIANLTFGPSGAVAVMTYDQKVSDGSGRQQHSTGTKVFGKKSSFSGGPHGYIATQESGRVNLLEGGKESSLKLPEPAEKVAAFSSDGYLAVGSNGTLYGLDMVDSTADSATEVEIEVDEDFVAVGDHLLEFSA